MSTITELRPATLGQRIDALHALRVKKAAAEKIVKNIEDEIKATELDLIEHMDKEATGKAAGKRASVTIQESVVPSVEDWDAFYKYISKMKYFHLLERRPSVTGCRELFDTKGKIPGVVPFTKRRLHVSAI